MTKKKLKVSKEKFHNLNNKQIVTIKTAPNAQLKKGEIYEVETTEGDQPMAVQVEQTVIPPEPPCRCGVYMIRKMPDVAKNLSAWERETVIGMCDADDIATVYTTQRKMITKLLKNPAAELTKGDVEGVKGTAWAEFKIPCNLVSFRSKKVKRELTKEQREQLVARMKKMRERKG